MPVTANQGKSGGSGLRTFPHLTFTKWLKARGGNDLSACVCCTREGRQHRKQMKAQAIGDSPAASEVQAGTHLRRKGGERLSEGRRGPLLPSHEERSVPWQGAP